jgi:hypothetical protein
MPLKLNGIRNLKLEYANSSLLIVVGRAYAKVIGHFA